MNGTTDISEMVFGLDCIDVISCDVDSHCTFDHVGFDTILVFDIADFPHRVYLRFELGSVLLFLLTLLLLGLLLWLGLVHGLVLGSVLLLL